MEIDLMRVARSKIEWINPHAVEGGTILESEFIKGSIVAGLRNERIRYIVDAKREEESLAQFVETTPHKESENKSPKFKRNQGSLNW
jgi:hypothetical protein